MKEELTLFYRLSTGRRRDLTYAQNAALTTTARDHPQTYQHWIAKAHVIRAPAIAKQRCAHG